MEYQYCTTCLSLSSRPRVTFNDEGVCSACQWVEAKKMVVDWKARWQELEALCDRFRCKDGSDWDVIVPCSGGKDGSYVAWKMKHDLGMHPLCVTLLPQYQTEVGRQNLKNFKKSGFDHITITPNPVVYKKLAIKGFKEQGRPKLPFVTGISTAVIKLAMKFDIPFVMYGEEGEVEYGGTMEYANRAEMDREYLVKYSYSGYDTVAYLDEFTRDDLKWWLLPGQEEMAKTNLLPTSWSYFENWDPELHANLAKEKCGLQTVKGVSAGTFTDYAQLDDVLQDLHAYMMFVKFGFGRALSDAAIEIRAGRMTREEGVENVKKLDGVFPEKYLPAFLDYFGMTEAEFWSIVDSWVHKDLLEKCGGRWKLKTTAVKGLERGGKFEIGAKQHAETKI